MTLVAIMALETLMTLVAVMAVMTLVSVVAVMSLVAVEAVERLLRLAPPSGARAGGGSVAEGAPGHGERAGGGGGRTRSAEKLVFPLTAKLGQGKDSAVVTLSKNLPC